MKKLIALLAAASMLVSAVAFAETTEEVVEVTDDTPVAVEEEDLVNFDVVMDDLPAGYQRKDIVAGGYPYAEIYSEDEDAVIYFLSAAHTELYDGYTFKKDEISEDDLTFLETLLSDGYEEPVFTFDQTSHGTDVILVTEKDNIGGYAEYVTIYEGFFMTVAMIKDTDLTSDDLTTGLKVMSDMWVVTK